MKRNAFLFGVATILMVSCSTTSENTMKINGNFEGFQDQTVYLTDGRKLAEPTDSFQLKDGKFSYEFKFDVPSAKYLQIKPPYKGNSYGCMMFFVEKGTLNIASEMTDKNSIKIQFSGTKSNELWVETERLNREYYEKEKPLRTQLSDAQKRYSEAQGEQQTEIKAEIDKLKNQINELFLETDTEINKLVNDNISTLFAAFYIMENDFELRNSIEKTDSILKVFEAAGMTNNKPLEVIKQRRDVLMKTAPGMPVIDFTLKTIDGKDFNLMTEMKGKVFVIDFWASWCGPCRRENPHMVETYAKYKDMGFDAVSVSVDRDTEAWKKAVADDKLTWHQVINDNENNAQSVSKQYGVSSIPTIFLIDKEGKIVARGLRGEALAKKIEELLNK